MSAIKKLRIERGLTQKQLADILDVDRTTIVKYETGKNGPSSEQLEKLANFFETSIDYLLGRVSQSQPESTQKRTQSVTSRKCLTFSMGDLLAFPISIFTFSLALFYYF